MDNPEIIIEDFEFYEYDEIKVNELVEEISKKRKEKIEHEKEIQEKRDKNDDSISNYNIQQQQQSVVDIHSPSQKSMNISKADQKLGQEEEVEEENYQITSRTSFHNSMRRENKNRIEEIVEESLPQSPKYQQSQKEIMISTQRYPTSQTHFTLETINSEDARFNKKPIKFPLKNIKLPPLKKKTSIEKVKEINTDKEKQEQQEQKQKQEQTPSQTDEKNLTVVKVSKNNLLKILSYITALLLLTSSIFLVIFHFISEIEKNGIEEDQLVLNCEGKNRNPIQNCYCLPTYIESLGNPDCLGPFSEVIQISPEEVQLSMAGQEENFVTRLLKQKQIEYYSYSIESVQKMTIAGQTAINKTETVHNLAILSTNVTETDFSILLYFQNSTYYQGENFKETLQGYPLLTQEEEDTPEDQINLNQWQEHVRTKENLSILDFFKSNSPIIEAKISKKGEILNVNYPINMEPEKKQLLPAILNLYSPPLTPEKINLSQQQNDGEIDGEGKSKRTQNTQPGPQNTTEYPEFQAEVDTLKNEAKISKNYETSTQSDQGKSINQKQNYNAQSNIKNGRIEESASASTVNLLGSPSISDNNNNGDGNEGGIDSVVNTQELIEEMAIDTFTKLKFQSIQELQDPEIEKIFTDFQQNKLKYVNFTEFQQNLFEELEFQNQIPPTENSSGQRRYLNIFNFEEDGELQDGELLTTIDGEIILFPLKEFQLFNFDLVGLKITGKQQFYCVESPPQYPDDWCFINPIFELGGRKLKDIKFKVDIPITRYIKEINWLKYNMIQKTDETVNYIEERLKKQAQDLQNQFKKNKWTWKDGTDDIISEIQGIKDKLTEQAFSRKHIFDTNFNETIKNDKDFYSPLLSHLSNSIKNLLFSHNNKLNYLLNEINIKANYHFKHFKSIIQKQQYISPKMVKAVENMGIALKKKYLIQDYNVYNKFIQKYLYEPISEVYKELELLELNEFINDGEFHIYKDQDDKEQYSEEYIHEYLALKMANYFMNNSLNREMNTMQKEQKEYIAALHGKLEGLYPKKIKQTVKNFADQIEDIKEQCQAKLKESHQDPQYIIRYFTENLNIFQLLDHKELHAQETDFNPTQVLQNDDLIQQLKEIANTTIQNKKILQNHIHSYINNTKQEFQSGFNDLKANITELTLEFRQAIQFQKKEFNEVFRSSFVDIQAAMKSLTDFMISGNPDHKQLDTLDDYTNDIKNLTSQSNKIASALDTQLKEAQEIIKGTDKLPELFEQMTETVSKVRNQIFENCRDNDLYDTHSNIISAQNFKTVAFGEYLDKVEEELLTHHNEVLSQETRDELYQDYNNTIQQEYSDYRNRFEDEVQVEVPQVNTMFSDAIKDKIDWFKFDYDLRTFNLMSSKYNKKFQYSTPSGVLFYIDFNVTSLVKIQVNMEIPVGKIVYEPNLISTVTSEIEGGIHLKKTKIGWSIVSTLFQGTIAISLILILKGQQYRGSISIMAYLDAFKMKAKVFFQKYTSKEYLGVCKNKEDRLQNKQCLNTFYYWSDREDLIDPIELEGAKIEKEIYRQEF